MQISGKVVGVKETQKVNDTFQKRELWIETKDGEYTQTLSIEFAQDKCKLLDDIAINEDVTIEFNLRGRQHKDRVYNTIAGWKITAANHGEKHNRPAVKTSHAKYDAEPIAPDAIDDLPF